MYHNAHHLWVAMQYSDTCIIDCIPAMSPVSATTVVNCFNCSKVLAILFDFDLKY